MEAKLKLNGLHCKSHCEPLSEDTCVQTQAFRPKRRRAKQPINTNIIRVDEEIAIFSKSEETDAMDQSSKNSTQINHTDSEPVGMTEEYHGEFLDTLVVSDSEYENPVIEARGEWWLMIQILVLTC